MFYLISSFYPRRDNTLHSPYRFSITTSISLPSSSLETEEQPFAIIVKMTRGKLVPNAFNLLVVIAVALGSTACSYGMSVISSTIGQPSFYVDLGLAPQGTAGYARTAQLIGAFNGVNSAGSALAAPFTAWTANKIGRLRTIELGALITIIGGALCGGSVNIAMFLVARFIAGWGVGTLITAIPMYQAEVSTPESRGFMVSMHGIMFAVGYSLSAYSKCTWFS